MSAVLHSTPENVLRHLAALAPSLRRSERKVAAVVLQDPESVVRMTLAELAEAAAVSQPTALRFCRAAGCTGFPDIKIRIAQALARGAPYVHAGIEPGDPLPILVDKVFASSIEALQALRTQIDMDAVARAVDAIAAARRIDLIGSGLSSVAALDAHQKLMRLGVPTVFHADSHLQRMSAATLGPADVALAFSYTGALRDVVRTVETARAQEATVIGITRSGSAMAKACSIVIGVDTLENTFVYAPMITRLAHLVVVDTLSTAVAMRAGRTGAALIRRVKRAMRAEWLVDGTADDTGGDDTDGDDRPGDGA